MAQPCEEVHKKCEPRNDKKVAFFAGLSNHLGPVNHHSDLVFDNIVTNVGSAYNLGSGRFTAPVRATYHFNVTISAQIAQKAAVKVLKNGVNVMTVWAESTPNWATSSNVAILSLEAGDQVWLQLLSGASHVYGNMYTTFSGFLVFEA